MAFVYWIHLPEHTDITSEGYIGFTSRTVAERYRDHRYSSKVTERKTYKLYNAINKYGDALIVTTLLEGSSEYCLMIENKLRPQADIGWNIRIGGEKGNLGLKASEETRKKQSQKKLGSKFNMSPEQRAHRSFILSQRVITEETKRKMSLSKKLKMRIAWKNHKSDPLTWVIAKDLYTYYKDGFDTKTKLSNKCGIEYPKLSCIVEKFKSGWNPNEDPEYLAWLASYKEQNE